MNKKDITGRLNAIGARTGHCDKDIRSIAEALGFQLGRLTHPQLIALRNNLYADWAVAQGAFSLVSHALQALQQIEGCNGHNDLAVWGDWFIKVEQELAEIELLNNEVNQRIQMKRKRKTKEELLRLLLLAFDASALSPLDDVDDFDEREK